jgi:hypothetical protein
MGNVAWTKAGRRRLGTATASDTCSLVGIKRFGYDYLISDNKTIAQISFAIQMQLNYFLYNRMGSFQFFQKDINILKCKI